MKNLVAIVGKPNVGKSTLFNKLIGKRISIVHNQPGVTRDRLYHEVKWTSHEFKIIDTGGIEVEDKPFQEQIKIQAEIAIEEAKVIIFVVDGKMALSPDEEQIIRILRKSNKPIIVAANKLEGMKDFDSSIWTLGIEDIFPISAIHGEGIGDMLDKVVSFFDEKDSIAEIFEKIAIIGRPNAGKSSLLNFLANKERSIVSNQPGTTRDSVDAKIKIFNQEFKIIDTAGINRKSKLVESVDHYALNRAMNSIDDADIVLLMIDVEREIAHFDSVVGGYAFEKNKPIIIIINKWDKVEKETNSMQTIMERVKKNFKYISWAPIVFISATTGSRIHKLKEAIQEVSKNMKLSIKTSVINEIISDIQMMQPSPSFGGGRLQITFVKQIPSKIPTFTLFCNNIKYLHFSYKRYIENSFREHFILKGTPIKLLFRNKRGDDIWKK